MINKVFNGKLYLTVEKCPYYRNKRDTGFNRLFKKLFSIGKYNVVIREKDITGLNERGNRRLLNLFTINNKFKEMFSSDTHPLYFCSYNLLDNPFLLNGDNWKLTEHYSVLFNENKRKYYGFTHRGGCMFGIGDTLFDTNNEDVSFYYRDKKLRWKLLTTLLKYHFKNNVFRFEDMFEDRCIGSGITNIVPFKKRGSKLIETLEEAKQAAINMRNYLS